MANTILGLDIGGGTLKMAAVGNGRVQKLAAMDLPDNLVRQHHVTSAEALAQELLHTMRENRISAGKCALVLPPEAAIVRRISMPYMTVEQLKVNLPYEFHDYIQNDKNLYFYDYAVVDTCVDESGAPQKLELLAAAARKDVVAEYRRLLRRAGLKLVIAVPEYLTIRNLIRAYESTHPEHPAEYCVVDMGHTAIRMHMYRGAVYDTTRVIEYGGGSIDALIADAVSVDPHLAADYKRVNYEGAQELPACRDLYARIAVEILRAVNFYGFNTPNSDLRDIYFGGGLARVAALMEEIRGSLDLRIHSVEELLPEGAADDAAVLCSAAVGAALQSLGR